MLQRIVKCVSYCLLCGGLFFDAPGVVAVTQADETVVDHKGMQKEDIDKKWTARRIAYNGAVLRLLVPESSASDYLPLNVIVENRGKERFQCGETPEFLDCILTLTSKGSPVSYSKKGRTVFSNVEQRTAYGKFTYTAGRLRSWEFNLADAFEPLKNGEYLLTLEATVVFETPGTENEALESKKFATRVQMVAKDVSFVIVSEDAVASEK